MSRNVELPPVLLNGKPFTVVNGLAVNQDGCAVSVADRSKDSRFK